jgi:L-lysine 2,3-aminomutase
MPRNLFVAIAVSTFLALMLSLVPGASWKQADVPTFQTSRPIQLNEQNALDLFTMVATHYNIKRIKWENSSVYVDLAVLPAQEVQLSHVYQDFYGLTYNVFTLTDNVQQVYFRLLEESDTAEGSRLLVAIHSNRSNHSAYAKSMAEMTDVATYVRSTFPVRIEPYFYERISP